MYVCSLYNIQSRVNTIGVLAIKVCNLVFKYAHCIMYNIYTIGEPVIKVRNRVMKSGQTCSRQWREIHRGLVYRRWIFRFWRNDRAFINNGSITLEHDPDTSSSTILKVIELSSTGTCIFIFVHKLSLSEALSGGHRGKCPPLKRIAFRRQKKIWKSILDNNPLEIWFLQKFLARSPEKLG